MRSNVCFLLAALAACSESSTGQQDSGISDIGSADAADTGAADSGLVRDAGAEDAGISRIGCAGCTVFLGGQIFDGTEVGASAVVTSGDRIVAVAHGPVEVTAGEIVDLSGRTLMPGLFDLHVHMGPSAASQG